jgi:hypothetical protein
MYRTDRVSLAPAGTGVLSADPGVVYRSDPLPYNSDVQNPKSLNAVLPDDVDTSTGVDGSNVYTRAPQVAKFFVAAAPGSPEHLTLWAISNHFSSTPDARVGQRTEQAAYGAAITNAVTASEPGARIVYGGDLNVFPRPDDPIPPSEGGPSDQLGPLYEAGLHNLWEDLAAQVPSAAYSYVFQGQAQTLDHLFVNPALQGDLVQMRAAHVNAGWPADFPGDGPRGVSDHDPQIARFSSRASLSVADVSVVEGEPGTTTPATFTVTVSRPLSQPIVICAATLGLTASDPSDYNGIGQCQTLAAGATSVTFTVTVKGDNRKEGNEKFVLLVVGAPFVALSDPIAFGTITNDD